MVEFNVRIDFFRDLEEDGPKGYVGSALRDGLRPLVAPRVGEHVHGLGPSSVWYGPTGAPAGPTALSPPVEHARARLQSRPDPGKEQQPTVTVVVRPLWPGDGPLAGERLLRDYDQQGWKLHFFSDTPVQAFPGQQLM